MINTAARRSFSNRPIYRLPVPERAAKAKMLICDMAGTVVHEGGLVYSTLQKVMNDRGLEVSDEDMIAWHGAQKTEVVENFVKTRVANKDQHSTMCDELDKQFEIEIQDAYFLEGSPVRLIHEKLPDFLSNLRASGCKVALCTGYPVKIQQGLIKKLGMADLIDCAVCAEMTGLGRP